MRLIEIIRKNILKTGFIILFPVLLVGILFLIVNYEIGSGFLTFIDQGLLISKSTNLINLISLWSDNNLGLINSITIPLTISAKAFSWTLFRIFDSPHEVTLILFFLASVFVYISSLFAFLKIQKSTFGSNNIIFPSISAFLYSFNFSAITNTGVLDSNFHILALSPILLYLLIDQINGAKGVRFIFLEILLISLIINNIPFALGFLLTLYIPYLLFNSGSNYINSLLKYILVLLLTLITSSYFLYSYYYAYKNIVAGAFFTIVSEGGFVFLNNGIGGLFGLVYDWTTQIFYNKSIPHPYFHYYLSKFSVFTAFAIWASVAYSIFSKSKKNLKLKPLLYLLVCVLLSFFFIKGNQNPFGWVNTRIYELNPIMNILRTPSSKFAMPIMMYLSVLVLFVLNMIKNNLVKWAIAVLVMLHVAYFFNPIRFIGYHTFVTEKSVGYISESYMKVSAILNSDGRSGAVYMYPSNSAGFYKIDEETFYGQDILGKLIKRPVIHTDNTIMKSARESIDKISPDFNPKYIGGLSIRYVILRNDFDKEHMIGVNQDVNYAKTTIEKTNGFKKIFDDGVLTVYELRAQFFRDLITASVGGTKVDLTYEKTSPFLYKVTLKNQTASNILVKFNNSYDNEWIVRSNNSNFYSIKEAKTSEFGNSWLINGGNKFEIYYSAQNNLFIFLYVSLFSFIVIVYLSVLFCKKEKKLLQF